MWEGCGQEEPSEKSNIKDLLTSRTLKQIFYTVATYEYLMYYIVIIESLNLVTVVNLQHYYNDIQGPVEVQGIHVAVIIATVTSVPLSVTVILNAITMVTVVMTLKIYACNRIEVESSMLYSVTSHSVASLYSLVISGNSHLLISNGLYIHRLSTDGTRVKVLHSSIDEIKAVDYDYR